MLQRLVILVLSALAATGGGPTAAAEAEDAPPRLGQLQGGARLARNRPVIGASVQVRPMDRVSEVFVTVSDGDGRFLVDDLPNGSYRVEVRREGLRPVVKEDVWLRYPARAVIEVRMERAEALAGASPAAGPDEAPASTDVSLRGDVFERGGAALADARLRFVRIGGAADPLAVHSAADGRFDLGRVPSGDWRLEARVAGFLPVSVTLDLSRDTDLSVSLVPQPAGHDPSPLELMPAERAVPPPPLPSAGEGAVDPEEGPAPDPRSPEPDFVFPVTIPEPVRAA